MVNGWRVTILIAVASSRAIVAEAAEPSPPANGEHVGCLTWGFEDAFFRPLADNGKVQWWVAAVPDDFGVWLQTVPMKSGLRMMFARVIASVGAPGEYGHMGMGSREIRISEILELRQFEESDGACGVPPPPVPPPDSFPAPTD
jgi:hypothetical protein